LVEIAENIRNKFRSHHQHQSSLKIGEHKSQESKGYSNKGSIQPCPISQFPDIKVIHPSVHPSVHLLLLTQYLEGKEPREEVQNPSAKARGKRKKKKK
jgi:hypothetical protein